jgi:hypothetical protein
MRERSRSPDGAQRKPGRSYRADRTRISLRSIRATDQYPRARASCSVW